VGERTGVCRVVAEKSEGKRPLVKPKRRREYNIKMNFKAVG
jgi:hypothetical protein